MGGGDASARAHTRSQSKRAHRRLRMLVSSSFGSSKKTGHVQRQRCLSVRDTGPSRWMGWVVRSSNAPCAAEEEEKEQTHVYPAGGLIATGIGLIVRCDCSITSALWRACSLVACHGLQYGSTTAHSHPIDVPLIVRKRWLRLQTPAQQPPS